ncbi:DoxX family protein [Pseudopedobacter saltans DSM 12145]|uniref:DoxX family protein n=1 Tax=Pseudopedobacter saltans (strain ATCC 51119 / DSM 12145 / JCM 21818 / CCUG 39354 / LMG 10337 / NBRC 100064 / NCIMB 13643) TaxID=762903 RepID=F0S793_PSESL|nr:DoxX family protein [Pseudopedobacter saltans]ADY54366.1 DoxX family protein [Pseudopedobacter saltans DSM 12145]
MNLVHRIEHWGDYYHSKATDVIRICLGVIILIKGITVIMSRDAVYSLLIESGKFDLSSVLLAIIVHYIVFAHILGGIFLIVGLLTRFAAVIQIPILLGAVFFVNIAKGFTFFNSELWLSLIVLLLLIMFWIIGAGPYSVDNTIKRNRQY